jgi:hypothetical protein
MKNSRRDLLKKVSITGLAALALPEMLTANAERNDVVKPDVISKRFLFQGDSITDGNRSRNTDWNHVLGHGYTFLIASRLNYEYPRQVLPVFMVTRLFKITELEKAGRLQTLGKAVKLFNKNSRVVINTPLPRQAVS